MRGLLLAMLMCGLGCGKSNPGTESDLSGVRQDAKPKDEPPKELPAAPAKKGDESTDPPKPPVVPEKKNEPKTVPPEPKKPQYDGVTAGKIGMTDPANLWGLPDQNRAVLKEKYFGKRWDIAPDGNITVETDRILSKTHPHTTWLTVTVKFRDPKDLLTFDRYKSKLNGYCVDAFTFVDCVYVK